MLIGGEARKKREKSGGCSLSSAPAGGEGSVASYSLQRESVYKKKGRAFLIVSKKERRGRSSPHAPFAMQERRGKRKADRLLPFPEK